MSDLVHSVATDSNVLSLVAEHTPTLSDLVHSVATNPNVLSLVADSLHTNILEESSTLLIDHATQVEYRSGDTQSLKDLLHRTEKTVDDFMEKHGGQHLSPGTSDATNLSREISSDTKFNSADYSSPQANLLVSQYALEHMPHTNIPASDLNTMFGKFEDLYKHNPMKAAAEVDRLPDWLKERFKDFLHSQHYSKIGTYYCYDFTRNGYVLHWKEGLLSWTGSYKDKPGLA
jgi:hypothetical protein